jgi:hypothetical protein
MIMLNIPALFIISLAEQIKRSSNETPLERKSTRRDDFMLKANRSRDGNATGARITDERVTIGNSTRNYTRQAAGNRPHQRRDFSMNAGRAITDVMSQVITKNMPLFSLFFSLCLTMLCH